MTQIEGKMGAVAMSLLLPPHLLIRFLSPHPPSSSPSSVRAADSDATDKLDASFQSCWGLLVTTVSASALLWRCKHTKWSKLNHQHNSVTQTLLFSPSSLTSALSLHVDVMLLVAPSAWVSGWWYSVCPSLVSSHSGLEASRLSPIPKRARPTYLAVDKENQIIGYVVPIFRGR